MRNLVVEGWDAWAAAQAERQKRKRKLTSEERSRINRANAAIGWKQRRERAAAEAAIPPRKAGERVLYNPVTGERAIR